MGGCVSSSSNSKDHPRPQGQNRPVNRPELSPDDSQLIPLTDLPPNPSTSNDRTATNSPHSEVDPSSSTSAKGKAPAIAVGTTSLTSSSSRFSLGSLRRARSGGVMSRRNVLNILREYATLPHPQSTLPANVLLFANRQCIAIFDAYPKAKYHFLVLPRYPFPSQSEGETDRSLVKLDQLDDLQSLLTKTDTDSREEIISAMLNTAREVEEMIRDEMVKTEGFEWKIDVGFHAVPSMKHVHLHVISEDRIAPGYKTKKHHNSFRPDLGFFLDIMEVQRWIHTDEAFVRERAKALPDVAVFLDSQLACFKCDEYFSNMPKLKAHLEKEWKEEKKKTLDRIRTTGSQYRSSDEDDLF